MGTMRMRMKGKARAACVDLTTHSAARHRIWMNVNRCIFHVFTCKIQDARLYFSILQKNKTTQLNKRAHIQVIVSNMELTANEAEVFLVGGQLNKKKKERKRTFIINTRTYTSVAHTSQTIQDRVTIQDNKGGGGEEEKKKKKRKKKDKHTLNIDKTLHISITLKQNQLNQTQYTYRHNTFL